MRISDWSSDVCSSDLHLAADIQRQVGGIDHAAQEAQPGWYQLVAAVGDEDPAHIQLELRLARRLEQVRRPAAGHEQQQRVIELALAPVMQGQPEIGSTSCRERV